MENHSQLLAVYLIGAASLVLFTTVMVAWILFEASFKIWFQKRVLEILATYKSIKELEKEVDEENK